jgi:mevalonate kinase
MILCGEHAVVYGQPAIAIPVSDLRVTVTAKPAEKLIFALAETGLQILDLEADAAITQIARLTLDALQIAPPTVELHIASTIPVASGLGSGAAVSAAVARCLCHIAGKTLPVEMINQLVYEVEKMHHGTPSGIDNTVIVYERPIYFVRGQAVQFIHINTPLHFLIADTGIPAPTKISVGDVRRLYDQDPEKIQPVLDAIGTLVHTIQQQLQGGDAKTIGNLLTQNHHWLQQLTVSSPALDNLVTAALQAGALGAKLSGGGRGGNMLALVTPETLPTVKTALLSAGAIRVYETSLRGDGA